jgi:hypothetical protein
MHLRVVDPSGARHLREDENVSAPVWFTRVVEGELFRELGHQGSLWIGREAKAL